MVLTVPAFLALFLFGVPFAQMCSEAGLWPVLLQQAFGILSLLALYLVAAPNIRFVPRNGRFGIDHFHK